MTEEAATELTVFEAIEIGVEYLRRVYPNAEEFLVEETERASDGPFWNITVSMNLDDPRVLAVQLLTPAGFKRKRRVYKSLKISRESGEVVAMKIREPAHA